MIENKDIRKILLYLAIAFRGDFDKIFAEIQKRPSFDMKKVEQIYQEFDGNFITLVDKEYPEQLKQTFHPPFVLFYEGNIDLLKSENVKLAIGNESKINSEEKDVANLILTDDDPIYVLGGRSEMDDYLIATRPNKCIVVFAQPLYNSSNKVKKPVLDNGGLILTEYPDNAMCDVSNNNFINRYRIIAGISDKTLILFALKTGGNIILVNHTLHLGKDVLVAPVSPLKKEYVNNDLIFNGATLVYDHISLQDCLK